MPEPALLVLEDGTTYEGYAFGAERTCVGEVVFNTSMTGYQEVLTDPSYAGQIVTLTYPIVGNYGINEADFESKAIQVQGLVVREDCEEPSHWQCERTLSQFLAEQGVSGIYGVDTRALTRRLRSQGVMMGVIAVGLSAGEALERLRQSPAYGEEDYVRRVSAPEEYDWPLEKEAPAARRPRVVVVDYGTKYNILRILTGLGCRVSVVPCTWSAEEVLALGPDGIVFSPGPGDPSLQTYAVETAKRLIGRRPLMGICLGHQLLGQAFGARTFKLKFGHRGANHPVRDLVTGRVHITAQNHGYAVDADTLGGGAEVSHVSLNDGTVEGLRHPELPIVSIQYHSEASPGPQDNVYLFERFLEMVKGWQPASEAETGPAV